MLFRRGSRDDNTTTSLIHHGVYRLSDVEDEEIKKFQGATSAYSFWSAVKYTFVLTILLWWLPIFGQMIAGYVGGRRAGTPMRAILAALVPLIFIFGITMAFESGIFPGEINGVSIDPQSLFEQLGEMMPFIGPYVAFATTYIESLMGAIQSITLLRIDNYLVTIAFAYIGGIIADQTRRELEFVAEHGGHETKVIVGREQPLDQAPIRMRALRYTKSAKSVPEDETRFERLRSLEGDAGFSIEEEEQPIHTTKKRIAHEMTKESPRTRRAIEQKVKAMEREQKRVEKKVRRSGNAAGLVSRASKAPKPKHVAAENNEQDGSAGWEYI